MKLTLELLSLVDACTQGIEFAKRNNIIGRDIKELCSLKAHDTNLNWLRSVVSAKTVAVYDDKGRIIEMTNAFGRPHYERRYENDMLVYEAKGDSETYITLFKNGDEKHEYRIRGVIDGYSIYRNGIEIELVNIIDGHDYQFKKYEEDGDLLTVSILDHIDDSTSMSIIYKSGIIHKVVSPLHTQYFDERGNSIRDEYEDGDVYDRVFDENNNCIESRFNGRLSVIYEYDDKNQVIRQLHTTNKGESRQILTSYDDNGNVISVTSGNTVRTSQFIYDNGHLVDVKNSVSYLRIGID